MLDTFIETYVALILYWVGVTALRHTALHLPVKLIVWVASADLFNILRFVILHGWAFDQALVPTMAPIRQSWLIVDWFIIAGIARTGWKPGHLIAAWLAIVALLPMLPTIFTGRGFVGFIGLLQFLVPAVVTVQALRPDMAAWMDNRAKALVLVGLAAGMIAVTALSLINWSSTGSVAALTLASIALVGALSVPPSAAHQVTEGLF